MRALVQRVAWAEVEVDGEIPGRIDEGLLVYVGVATTDTERQVEWLAEKVANLRIFPDKEAKLNRSVQDVQGGVLVVSNFTLYGDARKGRRPSFIGAAAGEAAEPLTEAFIAALADRGCQVATGRFGAMMRVRSEGAGPVNVIVDTPAASAG